LALGCATPASSDAFSIAAIIVPAETIPETYNPFPADTNPAGDKVTLRVKVSPSTASALTRIILVTASTISSEIAKSATFADLFQYRRANTRIFKNLNMPIYTTRRLLGQRFAVICIQYTITSC